jgi:hypothetical protein
MSGRSENFRVLAGVLERHVVPARGAPYIHSCEKATFVSVLHAIDGRDGRLFSGENLVAEVDQPSSRVFAALAFLHERGLLERLRRKNCVFCLGDIFLDGMVEFCALAEKPNPREF